MKIKIYDIVGDFGEDKDTAAEIRDSCIKSCVQKHENITLDFEGVTLVTQSFVHALISDVLRTYGEASLDYLEFKSCTDVVKGIISTVVQYSLDTMSEDTTSINDE